MVKEQEIPSLTDHFNKKTQLLQGKRKVKSTLLLIFISSCLLGSTVFFVPRFAAILQVIGFLVIGYFFMQVVADQARMVPGTKGVAYTAVSSVGIFLILCAMFMMAERFFLMPALAGASAFALPYTLSELGNRFVQLSSGTYKFWTYTEDMPLQKSTTFLNSMPIRFKVQMADSDNKAHSIAFRAPVKMKLGLIFYHMIQDQNNNGGVPIELEDDQGQAYQWIFSTTRLGLTKYLDPDANLIEIALKENVLVTATRYSVEQV